MHPSEKFTAPSTILSGVPLKHLIDAKLVALISESFAVVDPRFDTKTFCQDATCGLEDLELKQRARHIAQALNRQLPTDTTRASETVIRSLGAPLAVTKDYGLAPFYYMPHSEWIGLYGIADFASGMRANYELTQRYTAEFSIRPFIVEHPHACLQLLAEWCDDPNPHVRRLASEGSRSRLPWASRLRAIQTNPELTLPLLEKLKDDPELYVRRSVANHLGDIAKDRLDVALELCQRWLAESQSMHDKEASKRRRWILRHALRYPAKKENACALKLRLAAK